MKVRQLCARFEREQAGETKTATVIATGAMRSVPELRMFFEDASKCGSQRRWFTRHRVLHELDDKAVAVGDVAEPDPECDDTEADAVIVHDDMAAECVPKAVSAVSKLRPPTDFRRLLELRGVSMITTANYCGDNNATLLSTDDGCMASKLRSPTDFRRQPQSQHESTAPRSSLSSACSDCDLQDGILSPRSEEWRQRANYAAIQGKALRYQLLPSYQRRLDLAAEQRRRLNDRSR
ncbi:hypothetical protein Poli38472_006447 [Pythium oligandrum]|uniref:Uncharacterized protein n=1 Tax=Pythium oligandrum TaxID=41045 RepID=A0A8K1C4N6_PYTOL|nr:hypothetical protein Poli38472_006447 [Pythium oligandrum]|eukprot:TMW56437.1 hypothetical protein Poli38472_006447 [Pythium oligandrum]